MYDDKDAKSNRSLSIYSRLMHDREINKVEEYAQYYYANNNLKQKMIIFKSESLRTNGSCSLDRFNYTICAIT